MTEERDIDLGFVTGGGGSVGRIARSARVKQGPSPAQVRARRSEGEAPRRSRSYFGGEVEEPLVMVRATNGALRQTLFEVAPMQHGVRLHVRGYPRVREALYYATVLCLLSGVRTLVIDVRLADAQSLAEQASLITGGREQRCLERELRVGPSFVGGVIAWRVRALGDPERTSRVLEELQQSYGFEPHERVVEEVGND